MMHSSPDSIRSVDAEGLQFDPKQLAENKLLVLFVFSPETDLDGNYHNPTHPPKGIKLKTFLKICVTDDPMRTPIYISFADINVFLQKKASNAPLSDNDEFFRILMSNIGVPLEFLDDPARADKFLRGMPQNRKISLSVWYHT
tara:strand:+ start:116 stop:544 length:429 start_codon:yes stop_codon:yes gene_type:complete